MAKKEYNPAEIPSTLDNDDDDLFGNKEEKKKPDDTPISVSQQSETETKRKERKLPDWMVVAAQKEENTEHHSKSPKKPVAKSNASKPTDIHIMSDEDLLEVARFFNK